jgi:hypothetical protein
MAAGNTYEAIATQTLGTAAASVTFSSIPGTYTDLVIVIAIAGLSAQETPNMYFNGDNSALYSTTQIIGNGSTASSNSTSNLTYFYGIGSKNAGQTTGVSNIIVQIPNYSNTTTFKNMISRNNSTPTEVNAIVGLYRSTSAVSSINFTVQGGNTYSTGTVFSIYGIKAA